MADPTLIGSGTFVRGRITGTGDIEIAGRIEGEVSCTGEVLVESSGLVGAGISARRIVIRGAVKGNLVAEEAVFLEAGARVVGDLRAPRIAIAPGGLVRGYVQTATGAAQAAPRARTAQASITKPTPVAVATRTPSVVTPVLASRESGRKSTTLAAPAPPAPAPPPPAPPPPAAPMRRVGPPPPLVPALKKGTKAMQKKR